MGRHTAWSPALLAAILGFFAPASHAAEARPVRIEVGSDAESRWADSSRVGFAIELRNRGDRTATNVRVRVVQVAGGKLVTKVPIGIGTIRPDASAVLQFVADVPPGRGRMPVRIQGTYQTGRETRPFDVAKPVSTDRKPSGPIEASKGSARVQRPQDARYPPAYKPALEEGPNAETPMLIPRGPPRRVAEPTPKGTKLSTPGGSISIPVNTTDRTGAGVPPDPSGASSGVGRVALTTYNTGIAVSTDGGATFTDYNLFAAVPGQPTRTTFFPQSDGGLCCDQVVIYAPRQNLFFWLLQYNPITACATNCTPPGPTSTYRITQASRLRLAWATPQQIAANFYDAWTYLDLTAAAVSGVSGGLGATNSEWLDYPDLAYSPRFLYVGVDHGFPTPGQVYSGRRIVARLSLGDIANTNATSVGYQFVELTGSNGLNKTHFVQNAPGRMVVASLDDTSTLKVFTWDDASNSVPGPAKIGISSIRTDTYTSGLADGTDWVAVGFPGNITGGTFRQRAQFGGPPVSDYMLAFTAGTNGAGRPRPFVRLETLKPRGASEYDVSEEYDIFNPDYAYAMAGLGSGSDLVTPEIGLSLFVGGGTIGYPQGVVGFKNDFVVYQVTGANAAQGSRFGDYVNARPVPGTETRFATHVYETMLPAAAPAGSTCATAGCSARMRYIEFERPTAPGPH